MCADVRKNGSGRPESGAVRRLVITQLALWVAGAALFRVAVVPPERCPQASPDEVRAAAVAAGDWLVRNMGDDGSFLYGYDRATGLANPAYNIVRHAGAVVALYQLVGADERRFLAAADRSLGWLLANTVEADDWAAVAEPGARAQLGTAGFTIVALLRRAAITGDAASNDLAAAMGRFVIAQQQPDGSILAFWDPKAGAASPDEYGVYATGEALWALEELAAVDPGGPWGDAASATFGYLISGERERKEGWGTRQPDHWAAYALEVAGRRGLDDDQVGYAGRLAGYFSLRLRIESQRTGRGVNVAVRGHPGPPAGVGTAGEGMAALYRLAEAEPRLAELLPDMAERLACVAGLMVDQQVMSEAAGDGPTDASMAASAEEGAWFYRDYTQVDDQQHVISLLLGAEHAMRWEPAS
jgi:hypothetical protein